MSKTKIFLAVLLAAAIILPSFLGAEKLTRQNWVASVGFAPQANPPGFAPNKVFDKSNVDKVDSLLPGFVKLLVKKYEIKIWTTNYRPIVPSNGFIAATNKYLGQAQAIDTGDNPRKKGISNYTAGLPFPKPKSGLEVAWNYQYSYNADDAKTQFAVYWIHARRGVEKWEEWTWDFIMRGMHRTDINPIPNIPELASQQIQYYSMTTCQKPLDKKGFTALYYRVEEPQDQQGWIYIPAQRRATRFSFGTRGDAWNNTDLLYEDVRGYMGYPEWMTWKIVGQGTFLAPMHAEIPVGRERYKEVFDFNNFPHWNFKAKWEPRPMYVVEAKPKFRDYPYSKMICYIDAETYYIVFKEAYDKRNQLWKILIAAYNASPDESRMPPAIGTNLVIHLQAEHATAFPWFGQQCNVGLGADYFQLSRLRRMGN